MELWCPWFIYSFVTLISVWAAGHDGYPLFHIHSDWQFSIGITFFY